MRMACRGDWRSLIMLSGVLVGAGGGCGGSALSQRYVDEPKGDAYEYGAPKNTQYSADVATVHDRIKVTVFQSSECDRILVKVMSRTQETLRGDEVVERQYVGPVQIADRTEAPVPCEHKFARGAQVALRAGAATYQLGTADAFGEVETSLSADMKQSLYGQNTPPTVTLLVQRQPIMEISLDELAKHEQRTAQLVAEFSALLGQTTMSPDDTARSYVLFEQLRQLDRGNAEVHGLCRRFLELVYQRKAEESLELMKKNLQALNAAKDLLRSASASVPPFVRVAIQSGETDARALDWAQGQVAVTVRTQPAACSAPFTWSAAADEGWPLQTRIALNYLRYAFDDPFAQRVQALCGS